MLCSPSHSGESKTDFVHQQKKDIHFHSTKFHYGFQDLVVLHVLKLLDTQEEDPHDDCVSFMFNKQIE
jgi:hypothetical protein